MTIFGLHLFEKRVIGVEGRESPLLIRWIPIRTKWFSLYIHKLCRSDYDRALHDHPWNFLSIILWNGYSEEIEGPIGRQILRHRMGDILIRPAQWTHRVIIDGAPCYTLVFRGSNVRKWGFHTAGGWCWWRQFNPEKNICEDSIIDGRGMGDGYGEIADE